MWLYEKLLDFVGIRALLDLLASPHLDLAVFLSRDGLQALIAPLFPSLLLLELMFLCVLKRKAVRALYDAYKIPVMSYLVTGYLVSYVTFNFFMACNNYFAQFALFEITYKWYWFLYAYVVCEFSHYIFHFSCHKVRLLWCLHAPHHAPTHMNLSVIFTAFFLHGFYAVIIRTSICAAFGVPLPMLVFVMVLDGCYGALIHVSEEVLPDGRFGFLHMFMLTPSHHRVHHARNPQYIDKNYCNTLNIWDRLFGTYQEELPGVRPVYGVLRTINERSFFDMYFGEFYCLIKDLKNTPGVWNKLKLIVMPPGWKPTTGVLTKRV